ncbi:hypothetical protein [Amycolatopsis saalfeldensis]|uniref:LigA protein n=1 Tax=Amycolatopsis saalfeldensis TaxID=394193 RepID=A0A1H8TAS7_9PSEU|nr:hypothetical protein [Amycolatopsis saalfeldensis]SEO87905.1 hypothetical protein SAMN04489732_102510 [Amycolatopsis saalfeldensis]
MRVRGQAVAAVVLLGFAAAACTTGGHALPAPLPAVPAATRALVGWSVAVCAATTAADGLRSGIDDVDRTAADPGQADFLDSSIDSYLSRTGSDIDQLRGQLKDVPASGVKGADAYVAALGKALGELQKRVPATTAKQPLAKAREVAAAAAALKPATADLQKAVRGDAKLNASFDVAPGCSPVRQFGPVDAASPTPALVAWSDTMCTAAASVTSLRAQKLGDIAGDDPRFAGFGGFELGNFIGGAGRQVGQLTGTLAPLAPTGVQEADAYRAGLLAALQAVAPKLPQDQQGMADLSFQPVDQLKTQAQQVIDVLATITMPSPDLPAAVAHSKVLANSYDVAPNCRPLGSPPLALPAAANGTDLGACQAGKCQVQVSGVADLTVSGIRFTLSIGPASVRVLQDTGEIVLSTGGSGKFGTAGHTVSVRVTALLDGKAVLDISTE